MTNKEDFNKRFKQPKDKSNSKQNISKLTGISMKILDEVYDRGIGAHKTSPGSVRRVKGVKMSPQQWAMARVYSFVNKVTGPKELNHDSDLAEKVRRDRQKAREKK
tara:strand:- start:3042 stop:3359 length:318 start_codon:yes stop_codon:yes gene_type:complete